jgi:hypothetical protein
MSPAIIAPEWGVFHSRCGTGHGGNAADAKPGADGLLIVGIELGQPDVVFLNRHGQN